MLSNAENTENKLKVIVNKSKLQQVKEKKIYITDKSKQGKNVCIGDNKNLKAKKEKNGSK